MYDPSLLPDRIAHRIVVDDNDCWIWTGHRIEGSCGQVMIDGKRTMLNRLAYELAHGPIPPRTQLSRTCTERTCSNPAHLTLRTRQPQPPKKKAMTDATRILSRARLDLDTGCWVWMGASSGPGYGSIKVQGKQWNVHRWYYQHVYGQIPEGLHIDHLCRNPPCLNPAHLEAVTPAENNRRAWAAKHDPSYVAPEPS